MRDIIYQITKIGELTKVGYRVSYGFDTNYAKNIEKIILLTAIVIVRSCFFSRDHHVNRVCAQRTRSHYSITVIT